MVTRSHGHNYSFSRGAIGRAYIALYQNMIPLKDENEMSYGVDFKQGLKRLSKLHSLLKDVDEETFKKILLNVETEIKNNDVQ